MATSSTSTSSKSDQELISLGQQAVSIEGKTVIQCATSIGPSFAASVRLIQEARGKVVVCGLGKSGHVARKIAATLASTGTPSFFLHPAEALHGDLGMIQPTDVLLCLAYGGETQEVVEVAKFAKKNSIPVVSITGNLDSTLAKISDHVLNAHVEKEVCPLNLAPTASSMVSLAIGDAIAVTLMNLRGFEQEQFAKLHPSGSLGRRLALVSEQFRPLSELPTVTENANFHEVLEAVTKKNFGIVPVVRGSDLVGAISDGDLRRGLLQHGEKSLKMKASELMKTSPKTISSDRFAFEALKLMEQHQITSAFVVEKSNPKKLMGIVRMHDLMAAKI